MDSRPITAILKALAESPVPVSEAHFDPEGNLTRIVLAPRLASVAAPKKDVSAIPVIAKGARKRTAIDSLRFIDEQMSSKPEPE